MNRQRNMAQFNASPTNFNGVFHKNFKINPKICMEPQDSEWTKQS